jgi:hypothetical protein
MRKIIILPFAELDIRDSVNYYTNKEEGLDRNPKIWKKRELK